MSPADRQRLADAVVAAVDRGLLPADATPPPAHAADPRPWPLLLLSALGAWLVALPMFGVVGALFGSLLQSATGLAVVGLGLLVAATVFLRQPTATPFTEQLAVPGLLVGGSLLGMGLTMAGVTQAPLALLMLAVALGVAAATPQRWLQLLCGVTAGAAALLAALLALQVSHAGSAQPLSDALRGALSLHAVSWLGWGLPVWLRGRLDRAGRVGPGGWAERIEPVAAGWQATALYGWASFAVWDVIGMAASIGPLTGGVLGGLSLLATLAAAALLLSAWPALRRPWLAAVLPVLLALAWAAPATGPVLLALVLAVTTRRRGRAALAGVVLVGVALGFFWSLGWPLADKALLLAGCGLWLAPWAVVGWRAERAAASAACTMFAPATARPQAAGHATAAPRWIAWAGVACAAATLLLVNLGIRDKEALIARGRPVYIELAPRDPRSLMQGDYMALRYRLDTPLIAQLAEHERFDRLRARARIDARGVAVLQRLDDTTPRAADELAIELTLKGGGWTVVSDAWFFREGDAARWQAARYGEFRVDTQGRALLVGLADAELRPIRPAPARRAAQAAASGAQPAASGP